MHYEHLIQINDPTNLMLAPLSRRQLWLGLLRRAERPQEFLIGVERVEVVGRGTGWFRRDMHIGRMRVLDHIVLEENQSVHYHTEAGDGHGGGSLLMRIEEPAQGALFVRFVYETALAEPHATATDTAADDTPEDAAFANYVRAAYRDTDIDSIRKIRALAESGELGELLL